MDAQLTELWQWVKPCLLPFTPLTCGEDPRFQEDFELIRQEIDNRSHCNFQLVKQLSHNLLASKSKDLRLAGYLTLALAKEYQIPGLITGLNLYQALLEQFPNAIYPQSQRARQAALTWLNNPRFCVFLATSPTQTEAIPALKKAIATFNHTVRQLTDEQGQRFNCLDEWLQTQTIPPAPEKKEPTASPTVQSAPTLSVSSAKEAEQLQLKIIEYWQAEKNWILSCKLARSWRWADMTLPVVVKGKQSNIAPPRKEAQLSLQKMTEGRDAALLFLHCEQLFLEPGGCYWLDLQRHAWQAAQSLREDNLAELIQTATRSLCQKHPGLLELQFANSMPFACSETQAWLSLDTSVTPANSPSEKSLKPMVEKQLKNKNLGSILAKLDKIHPHTTHEYFVILQAKGYACWKKQHREMAFIFYQELAEQIKHSNMPVWMPGHALLFWQEILIFLNNIKPNHLTSAQKDLQQDIQKNICLQNSAKAHTMLSSDGRNR